MKTTKDWIEHWNVEHKRLVRLHTGNSELINAGLANYCENLMLKAKRAYYETGKPIMSDHWFDRLEASLKLLRPESKVLRAVGSC